MAKQSQVIVSIVVAGMIPAFPAAGVTVGQAPTLGVSMKKDTRQSTHVVGWKAARRSPRSVGLLDSLRVTGPDRRPVRVQKQSAGRWKTIRVIPTTTRKKLDAGFVRGFHGHWRLKVPSRGAWRATTTSALLIPLSTMATSKNSDKARLPRPTPTPTSSPTPTPSSSFYGPSFQFDAMGNAQVGGTASGANNTFVSFRFKAEQSSQLTNLRAYWLDEDYPGYGGGNGGTFRVTVEPDRGGMPSGTVLAAVDVAPSTVFPLITFDSPATLSAGTMYHLVFTNIDPNPTVNFSSLDNAWVSGAASVPRQPNRNDAEYYAMCRKFGTAGSWRVEGQYTPIINLTYGNGSQQGQGYMETAFYDPSFIAGSSNLVRERITVSGGSRVVTGASVRIAKTSGSGDLLVRLEDANGTLIDSFSVSTGSVPTLATTKPNLSGGVWVSGKFTSPRTLKNGSTYNLRLSTDSSTSLWTRGIEQGDSVGYAPSTFFDDGLLEVSSNAGSTWTTVPGLATSGDLQFFLN